MPRTSPILWSLPWHLLPPLAALVALPCWLANDPLGTLIAIPLIVGALALPGSLILWLADGRAGRWSPATAFVLGFGFLTSAYDLLARVGGAIIFGLLLSVLIMGGVVLTIRGTVRSSTRKSDQAVSGETALAGAATALLIAPLFWNSGRLSGNGIEFFGPVGQSGFMHLALVQRLMRHVPPDNFVVAGLSPPFYHYYGDQGLALMLRVLDVLHVPSDLFDLCLRVWPTILYCLLGALAYRIGRMSLRSSKGGILSLLVLLGAGGLTPIFGLLQIALQVPDPTGMRLALFPEWTAGDGLGSIRSLMSRPAHAIGLLFCLAALDLLMRSERKRGDWIVAGLLLGLVAGFNYTLAATLGIAAVLACGIAFVRHNRAEAHDLGWLAAALFVGALPANTIVLGYATAHLAGAPLSGPTLTMPINTWGGILSHLVPSTLVSFACLIMFPLVAYGVRLFGLRALLRGDIAGVMHHGVGKMLATAFVLSFVAGTFFSFHQIGGAPDEKILLQPSLWMLGLFALPPLIAWLERDRRVWRGVALWGMLALTWAQSLLALDLGQRVTFSTDTVAAFRNMRMVSSADDVVAFLPVLRTGSAMAGEAQPFADFAITAMTGLPGYFGTKRYSIAYALSDVRGVSGADIVAAAQAVARRRAADVDMYLRDTANNAALRRLTQDHVRWIVLSGAARTRAAPTLTPWRKTPDMTVYRLPSP